jgi:carbon-monoxide dehydrogenase large subunit
MEIPPFHFFHQETPAPDIPGGIKGVGEAGTIAGVSLVASAVDDALSDLGVTVTRFPITPPRLLDLIQAAQTPIGQTPTGQARTEEDAR